jgi:tetratricopeptide (TPR) repeat protein
VKPLLLILMALSCPLGYGQENPADRAADAFLDEVQQLMQKGNYQRAEERLQSGPSNDPFALRLLLELTQRQGREDETSSYARRLLALSQSGQLKGSEEIAQAAYGSWQLGQFQDSNQVFIAAEKTKPTTVSMYVDWGNLYLTKYNAAEAESIFRDGIMVGRLPEGYYRWDVDAAYVGLAQALASQFKPGVDEALDKALELNPDNLDARVFKALQALKKSGWKEAEDWLEEGLDINPRYLPLLEMKCASQFLQDQASAFEQARDRILEINPNNGDLFETLGDLAASRRHFDQAIEFFRQALELNPRQESARASLGINLLRMGQEEEGTQVLEVAYSRDPFNIWTVNTLRLLDSFDRFVRFETPHLRVKLHEDEADALRPYAEELAERSLRTLQQKYNHQISGKYVFEMYPDHADFAVRTLGLPGLGALGATFGRIVAMDSPSARAQGEFHWGSTLWHELTHVVTLSLSKGKVPRWFTEGISMMEERQAGAGWGEAVSVGFVKAYENDALLPLADLNSGFEQPKSPQQLTLSYFQAGWICEFLALRYGMDKIRAMLVAFGEDAAPEEVFQEVLGASIEEVDKQFREELDAALKPLTEHLKDLSGSPLQGILQGETPAVENGEEGDLERLERSWLINPDNYFLTLQLGTILKALGRPEKAIPYLEKALEMFPTHADQSSPYALLSTIYEELGQEDDALEIRRRWWQARPLYIENAHQLASLLSKSDQHQEAARFLEEVMYLNPFQPETHERLGDIYFESDQFGEAVREFEVFLSLASVDLATAHFKLARALFGLGNSESSRTHVLLSLEMAPGYQEAQRLLLQLVRR